MRQLYVYRDGKLVEVERAPAKPRVHIQGFMQPTLHPVDGRHYTCPAAFRRVTRAAGMTEVGNESLAPAAKPEHVVEKEIIADVVEAVNKVEQGYSPKPLEHAGDADSISTDLARGIERAR